MPTIGEPKKAWFRPKRVGYGWTPNSWQGWGITVVGPLVFAGVLYLVLR